MKDLENNPVADQNTDSLRFIVCGSVDDGKSTLLGRLLIDTGAVLDDQLAALRVESEKFGTQGNNIDAALLLDGLQAEREQGITIDVAYRFFETEGRKFVAIDAPGHEQYTRNMATGASQADVAVLLIDATRGVVTQTKRHSHIVNLMGIKEIVLVINKMDLVNYNELKFHEIVSNYKEFISEIGSVSFTAIPVSALKGCNVVSKVRHYHGTKERPWSVPSQTSLLKINTRNYFDYQFSGLIGQSRFPWLFGYIGWWEPESWRRSCCCPLTRKNNYKANTWFKRLF